MRAVAAAMSTQYRPLSGMLCGESRRLLKQMDANIANECCDIAIEQIQAWLLVAHWELLCANEHQAMLTAGRAIRMVQLSRLHDIDSSSATFHSFGKETSLYPPSPLSEEECFASLEEKRRTFWLAYCFDRFCLLHNECQPYLQEESVSVSIDYFFFFLPGTRAPQTRAITGTTLIIVANINVFAHTDPHAAPSTRIQLSEQPTSPYGVPIRVPSNQRSDDASHVCKVRRSHQPLRAVHVPPTPRPNRSDP